MKTVLWLDIFLILRLTSATSVGSSEIELRMRIESLERSLERTRAELDRCHKQLESKSDSLVGQAWSTLGTCLAGSPEKTFKPFVSEILQILKLENQESHGTHLQRDIVFTSSHADIQTLRRFVLYGDVKFIEVQEILLGALQWREDDSMTKHSLDLMKMIGIGNKIHPNLAAGIIGCLVVCTVLLPLLLGARKRMIVLVVFAYSILHTWLGEYWKAVAKKEAILAKHGPNTKSCRLEKRGYAGSLTDFFSGLFNGKEDPCEEYYKAAMVDPVFEVNLVHALVESVSQLLGVFGGLGKAMGHFVNNFLAPLPLVWKVPALVVGAVLVVLLLMILSGYQFSTLLFSIGPTSRPKRTPSKKLTIKHKSHKPITSLATETETGSSDEDGPTAIQSVKKLKKDTAKPRSLPYPKSDQLHGLIPDHTDYRPSYQN